MIPYYPRYVEPFSPTLGEEHIPALKWEDTYSYLGVQIGRTDIRAIPTALYALWFQTPFTARALLEDSARHDSTTAVLGGQCHQAGSRPPFP